MFALSKSGPKIGRQGGWLQLALAGASLLGGLFGGKKESAAADREANMRADLEKTQREIAMREDARSQELYDFYKGTYQPLEKDLVREVTDNKMDPNVEAGRRAAEVRLSYGAGEEALRRTLARYGVDPTSGKYVGSVRRGKLAEAGATSQAMTEGRRYAGDVNFARLSAVAGLGRGLPATSLAYSSSAQGGLARLSSAAGDREATHDERGYAYGESIGSSLADIVKAVDSMSGIPEDERTLANTPSGA